MIMVNQFMFTFRRENGYLLNNSTKETWTWTESEFTSALLDPKYDYNFEENYFLWAIVCFTLKLGRLFSAVLGFMLLSLANALVVRVLLMCSNVIIFPMLEIMRYYNGQNPGPPILAQIYQQMGAIGAYSAHLSRMGLSKKSFLFALFFTLMIFYFMQVSLYYFWTQIFFPSPFAMNLNNSYFAYENFLEFFCFLFLRTRTSIKWLPKFITLMNVLFLFYINSYMYAAQFQFYFLVYFFTLSVTFIFLEKIELPAIQDWNPFDENTPRYASPRVAY